MDSLFETAKKTFADLFNDKSEKLLHPESDSRERDQRERGEALLAPTRRADPARRREMEDDDDNPRPSALQRRQLDDEPPPQNIFSGLRRPVPKPEDTDDETQVAAKRDSILKNSFAVTAQIVKKIVEIMQGGTQRKTIAPKTARFKKDM